jgi:hypothetical protein
MTYPQVQTACQATFRQEGLAHHGKMSPLSLVLLGSDWRDGAKAGSKHYAATMQSAVKRVAGLMYQRHVPMASGASASMSCSRRARPRRSTNSSSSVAAVSKQATTALATTEPCRARRAGVSAPDSSCKGMPQVWQHLAGHNMGAPLLARTASPQPCQKMHLRDALLWTRTLFENVLESWLRAERASLMPGGASVASTSATVAQVSKNRKEHQSQASAHVDAAPRQRGQHAEAGAQQQAARVRVARAKVDKRLQARQAAADVEAHVLRRQHLRRRLHHAQDLGEVARCGHVSRGRCHDDFARAVL